MQVSSRNEINELPSIGTPQDTSVKRLFRHNLSKRDIIILRALLRAKGRISNVALSRKLGIPVTTIYRRRKFIEDALIEPNTSINLAEFGWRKIMFDVIVVNGSTVKAMRQIEQIPNVVQISRGYGSKGIDIRVVGVIIDNSHIISLCDKMEAIEGVKEVQWFEIVQQFETNDLLALVIPEAKNITETNLHDIEE